MVRTEWYLESTHKPNLPCSSGTAKAAGRDSSLLHDIPTRVRCPAVWSFTFAYTFISQAAWAPLGPGWQLLILHLSSYEAPLTWKSSLAELSGKINTLNKYACPQSTWEVLYDHEQRLNLRSALWPEQRPNTAPCHAQPFPSKCLLLSVSL